MSNPARVLLGRAWRQHNPINANLHRHPVTTRCASTTSDATEAGVRSRFERFNARLPAPLRRYTAGLAGAPFSHVTSFLVLHELTAVAPLFALAGAFYYGDWLPASVPEWRWANEGMERFGRYARRKGWLSADEEAEARTAVASSDVGADGWPRRGNKALVAFATAWAITKALLPLRLAVSLWATPWFATAVLGPLTRFFSRGAPKPTATAVPSLGRGARALAVSRSPAAGTNAVGGGAIPPGLGP